MFSDTNVWIALGFTLFAGLSTGIGSAIAFFTKRTNANFLSISLGFSAGVMLYVSMIEIFFKAKDSLISDHGEKLGYWYTVMAFFGGMVFIALIDRLIPSYQNPHEVKTVEDIDKMESAIEIDDNKKADEALRTNLSPDNRKLLRMGYFSALAIAIHNFPEGLATFISALKDPSLGIPIAVAIAIHNIPEGIAVSVPIYYATGNKKKAFVWSFLSGLSEPVGAIIGFMLLSSFMSDTLFGVVFAGVAGIMVFISLDELLPTAREYGLHHESIYGLFAGMVVMAVSLLLFV